jgi:hypothetical protein
MLGYGGAMSDQATHPQRTESVELRLHDALEQGDAVLGGIAPVLRYLLAHDDSGLFGDAIVARVRGMMQDVARQLLERLDATDAAGNGHAALTAAIAQNPALLRHVHALVLEWQVTELLQGRLALDPVLSPLLQALIGSPDETTAALAMQFLAAQARFGQAQRRMRLPLGELPGDLLHGALIAMRTLAGVAAEPEARAAEAGIRTEYDEGRSRLGLLSRLVTGMGAGAVAALSLQHAGVALFLSTLAIASGQDRDLAVFATSETQRTRLALALLAAGLKPAAIEEQLLAFDPDAALPDGFARLAPDRAAALLAQAGR